MQDPQAFITLYHRRLTLRAELQMLTNARKQSLAWALRVRPVLHAVYAQL